MKKSTQFYLTTIVIAILLVLLSIITCNATELETAKHEYNQICSDENWLIPYMPDITIEKNQQIVNAMAFYRIHVCTKLRNNIKNLENQSAHNVIDALYEFWPFN